jgi:hypothetical protein
MVSKRKPQRRRKSADNRRDESLLLRLQAVEKTAFQDAAELAGVPVSAWIRERLRRAAVRELEAASQPIAFLKEPKLD